jgi:hypothetical protein
MERAGARSLPSTTTEECGRRELAVWHMGEKRGSNEQTHARWGEQARLRGRAGRRLAASGRGREFFVVA